MVERDGWKPRDKEAAFNAGSQGGSTSGKEAADQQKQESKHFPPDLAQRINDQFMGAQPDSTSFSRLYKYVEGYGTRPQGKWREFLQGLEPRERSDASTIVVHLIRAGYPDIGSVRRAEIEELYEMRYVGSKRAAFIKEMFKEKVKYLKLMRINLPVSPDQSHNKKIYTTFLLSTTP
jgi:hypothetical protein